MSELLLVAVPGVRIDEQGALLRVMLVPRLTGPGTTLGSYGLTDWPALVQSAEFIVRLSREDGTELEPFGVICHSDGDSAVWKTFFKPGLEVRPFRGQRTYDDPVVDQTTQHAGRIAGVYRESVLRRGDPDVVRSQLGQLTLDGTSVAPVDVHAPVATFDPPDFHRALALLREHPHVLRALGLIVDLHLPASQLDAAGDRGEVGVEWPAAPDGVGLAHGRATAYERAEGRFLPRSTRTITGGLVDLRTRSAVTTVDPVTGASTTHQVADWMLTTVDVDAAVARVSDAKHALATDINRPASLPALRTAGLTLLRRGRGAELARRNAQANGNARRPSAADGPALTADDLVLGYRLDVRHPGHEWHSLTRRKATYRVAPMPSGSGIAVDIGGGPVVEEGHVKPAAGVIGTDGTLRADEAVARWSGSNLAIPSAQPELVGGAPDRGPVPNTPHEAMPYNFTWTFTEDPDAPPDLELLFGADYQLRMRVVDLAGGGLELDDPPRDRAATPPHTYARQEPVPPPVIPPPPGLIRMVDGVPTVDRAFFGPGGSLDVLVVRSDPRGDDPHADVSSRYASNRTRMLLPPAVTFALAEQHGVLSGDDEATVRLARRAMAPPRASAEPRNGRQYTWLPDPVVDGVSATVVSLSSDVEPSDAAIEAWPEDAWPDHHPKTLQLSPGVLGGPLRVEWHPPGTLHVELPPARQADVELSSSLRSGVLDEFAAGAWILGPQPDTTLKSFTTSGRHPTVTPPRTVRVVHAVRRPLAAPRAVLQSTRAPADTGAALRDPAAPLLGVDRDSTEQVDVIASWDEWGDSATPQPMTEVVQSLPVGLTDSELPAIRHEFGDTKYRRIGYRLTARSRFRRYFAPDDPDDAFSARADLAPVDLLSTARPVPPVVVSIVPAFRWTDVVPEPVPIPDGIRQPPGPDVVPPNEDDIGTPPADVPADDQEVPFLTRGRSGGRLRIELGRPWYTTGQGEQLAVVLASVAGGAGSSTARESNLYRDPLYATPAPSRQPTESTMSSPAFQIAHVSDPDEPEHARQVTVALFDVRYEDGRPYTDVMLPGADATYCPLLRLTLARHQRHSLPGLQLSATITTEAVPILPSRTLVVDKRPAGLAVTLTGVGPIGSPNRVEARLEVAPNLRFGGTLSAHTPDADGQAWQLLTTHVGVLGEPLAPIPIPPDGRTYRLVIKETENLSPLDPFPIPDPLAQELARRVVFADVVML